MATCWPALPPPPAPSSAKPCWPTCARCRPPRWRRGGGRYLTPYALVRALRQGGIPAPGRADPAAVRLLTIHGAKGLEADAVLMLDTDAPPAARRQHGRAGGLAGRGPRARAASSFWPAKPARRPAPPTPWPPSWPSEPREEINALYVAMTRARQVLALSAVEPHRDSGRSPWRRIEPQAQAVDLPEGAAAATPDAQTPRRRPPRRFSCLLCPFPAWKGHKLLSKMKSLKPAPTSRDWAKPCTGCWNTARWRAAEGLESAGSPAATPGASPAHLAFVTRAAREFELPLDAVRQAATMARRIRTGEGRWAWDSTVIDWQGNEVTLLHAGVTQRIDRLVRRRDTGEWWVLDYKSAPRPEEQPELVAQMNRYRDAMRNANPGAAVRVAFLTGEGRVVEVPSGVANAG
jgi:ATP-dependent helicase/nuclease subunit A